MQDEPFITDWRSELRRTWAMCAATSTAAGPVVTYMLSTSPSGLVARAFVDSGGGRHLLLPGFGANRIPQQLSDGLSISPVVMTFGAGNESLLDIGCGDTALFGVFDELLASVLAESLTALDPIATAGDVLARWRNLLMSRADALGYRQQMGLFAELWVSRLLSTEAFEPDWWRGPLREPKDIVGPGFWIEVKAVSANAEAVRIHGLDQLAEMPGSRGFLALVTVTESPGGMSLHDLVGELRSSCIGRELFNELLDAAGFGTRIPDLTWSVDRLDVVRSEQCPRLTTGDLASGVPAGVGRVEYDLDVGVLRALSVQAPTSELRTAVTKDSQ